MNYYDLIERNKKDWPSLKYVLYLDEDAPNGAISLRKSIQETADKKAITSFAKPQIDATEVCVMALLSGTSRVAESSGTCSVRSYVIGKSVQGFRQLEAQKRRRCLECCERSCGIWLERPLLQWIDCFGWGKKGLNRWTIEDTLELIQRERE